MWGTSKQLNALVVVAHPDDETLWAGGTILLNSDWNWKIISLCRGDDPDRRPKFFKAVEALGVQGAISNVDDGPTQEPLAASFVQHIILSMITDTGIRDFDIIFTHSPQGEYTRHRRHEEVSRALRWLWQSGLVHSSHLRLFAYDDCGGTTVPEPIADANVITQLPDEIWQKKRHIIKDLYGFGENSFEAKAAGNVEAFWEFTDKAQLQQWKPGGIEAK